MWRGGLGGTYQWPALSSVGASLAPPCFRFHTPLIEPDVRICRVRLSGKTHAIAKAIACDAVRNFGKQCGGCQAHRQSPFSVVASCVHLQLKPLPSTGVTRLRRYYEPRRHPSQPGLSHSLQPECGEELVLQSGRRIVSDWWRNRKLTTNPPNFRIADHLEVGQTSQYKRVRSRAASRSCSLTCPPIAT